jgi:hypothetical protein
MGLTVTEALSEINLIKKKIEKKRETVLNSLIKPKHLKDKLESQGGSREFIKAELQSMNDLMARHLKLKGSIAAANIGNMIAVNGVTRSIHDWLNWKRDLSAGDLQFNTQIHKDVQKHFDTLAKQPQVFKDDDGKTHLLEYEANVEYGDFIKSSEAIQETLEKLDGQLSLKNATILLDV